MSEIMYLCLGGKYGFRFEVPYDPSESYYVVKERIAEAIAEKFDLEYLVDDGFNFLMYRGMNYTVEEMFREFPDITFNDMGPGTTYMGMEPIDLSLNSPESPLRITISGKLSDQLDDAYDRFPVIFASQDRYMRGHRIPGFRPLDLELTFYNEDDTVKEENDLLLLKPGVTVGDVIAKIEDYYDGFTAIIYYEGVELIEDIVIYDLSYWGWEGAKDIPPPPLDFHGFYPLDPDYRQFSLKFECKMYRLGG